MVDDTVQLKSDRLLEVVRQTRPTDEIVDVEPETVKIVVFICGGGRYAFYGSDIREILPPSPISWVPGLPPFLPGLINVRGDIESVVDLGPFLGAAPADAAHRIIAIAVRDRFRSGLLLDAIDDVMDVPVGSILPPLSTLSGAPCELALGEIAHQGSMITLLDMDKLAAKISL